MTYPDMLYPGPGIEILWVIGATCFGVWWLTVNFRLESITHEKILDLVNSPGRLKKLLYLGQDD